MEKWKLLEELEGVKINLNNPRGTPILFGLAMEQLSELIDKIEKEPDSQ